MKRLISALFIATMAMFIAMPAFAQDENPQITTTEDITTIDQNAPVVIQDATEVTSDTTVVVPVGNWISEAASSLSQVIGAIALAAFAFLLRSVPKGIGDVIRTFQVEQIIQRGVDYGINAVKGATKDKELTINVGHAVLAEALQYIIDQAPAWLVSWVGGPEALKKMILARLNLASASDADVMLSVQSPAVPK